MKLSVRDLSLGYGGRRVVERLTFEAFFGEFISLLGPSEYGKTTVLNALQGLLPPRRVRSPSIAFSSPVLPSVRRNCRE